MAGINGENWLRKLDLCICIGMYSIWPAAKQAALLPFADDDETTAFSLFELTTPRGE